MSCKCGRSMRRNKGFDEEGNTCLLCWRAEGNDQSVAPCICHLCVCLSSVQWAGFWPAGVVAWVEDWGFHCCPCGTAATGRQVSKRKRNLYETSEQAKFCCSFKASPYCLLLQHTLYHSRAITNTVGHFGCPGTSAPGLLSPSQGVSGKFCSHDSMNPPECSASSGFWDAASGPSFSNMGTLLRT